MLIYVHWPLNVESHVYNNAEHMLKTKSSEALWRLKQAHGPHPASASGNGISKRRTKPWQWLCCR